MKLKKLMLSDIKGSVYQPRSQDDLEMPGLEESILRNGLICPIIVRQYRSSYKIVCGNRRYEALRIIQTNRHPLSLPEGAASIDRDGLVSTLCLVLPSGGKVEDDCINALVDNIERLDLTPLERARCYKHMTKELKISVRKLAERLDMTHAYIAKLMRILDLPREIQQALDSRLISYNHVMVIMRLKGRQRQMELFKKIMEERLSPLDAEFWCKRLCRKGRSFRAQAGPAMDCRPGSPCAFMVPFSARGISPGRVPPHRPSFPNGFFREKGLFGQSRYAVFDMSLRMRKHVLYWKTQSTAGATSPLNRKSENAVKSAVDISEHLHNIAFPLLIAGLRRAHPIAKSQPGALFPDRMCDCSDRLSSLFA